LDLLVKKFRTDNGGEYVNSVVEQFLGSMGIKHQHNVPYNPQQNGKAERLNRILLEKDSVYAGRFQAACQSVG
jgi:transposase InsO family protein